MLPRLPQGAHQAGRVRGRLADHRGRGGFPGKDCSRWGLRRELPRRDRERILEAEQFLNGRRESSLEAMTKSRDAV